MNDYPIIEEMSLLPMNPTDVKKQVNLIQELMRSVMSDGEHFGKIPNCGEKNVLLKPGAEKLCFTFRLVPELEIEHLDIPNGHREYKIKCFLKSMITGKTVGMGVGSCSTMESKYRYRSTERVCPLCQQEAIVKGKAEYGGGWICWKKRGGCGSKFLDDDPAIVDQVTDKVENENPADQYNTILKIAKKRALVDATITALAASDLFTQDLEEDIGLPAMAPSPGARPKPKFDPGSKVLDPDDLVDHVTGEMRSEGKYEDEDADVDAGLPGFRIEIDADTAKEHEKWLMDVGWAWAKSVKDKRKNIMRIKGLTKNRAVKVADAALDVGVSRVDFYDKDGKWVYTVPPV